MNTVKMKVAAALLLPIIAACFDVAALEAKPPELRFWTVGGREGLRQRFGENFSETFRNLSKKKESRDAFLMALAEAVLTEQQIIRVSGLTENDVHGLIEEMQGIHFIKREGDRWSTNLPVITDREAISIKNALLPMARNVAKRMKEGITEIKTQYQKKKSPSEPSWDSIAHWITDKLVVDGSFHRWISRLEKDKGFTAHYNKSQEALPAFFLEQGKNFISFGTNWYAFDQQGARREVYILHGTLFDRYVIQVGFYNSDPVFKGLLFKLYPDRRRASFTEEEKKILDKLAWLDNGRCMVPIIDAAKIKPLLPLIDETGRAGAEGVFLDYSLILQAFEKSPLSKFHDAAGDYLQVCYHSLFSLVIEALIEDNIIPAIPRPVPGYFGTYITYGSIF